MITALNILILVVTSILTLSFLPHLKIFGVVPLLPLFFVLQLAYYRKGFEPVMLAALTGIFFDLFSPYPFGLYLALFVISATVVRYFFGEGLRTLSFWHYLALSGAAIFIYLLSQSIFLYLEGATFQLRDIIPYLISLGVNLVFASLMYLFGTWYFEMVPAFESHLKRVGR